METAMVKAGRKKYPVVIGNALGRDIAAFLKKRKYAKYAVITDETVGRKHGKALLKELKLKEKFLIAIRPGEKSKNITAYNKMMKKLFSLGLDRKSCLIGFGGGVVTDVTGFAASTYMRGIDFVLVPTTLLAMADSSIGGKTGLDIDSGKNIIGTFAQPDAVFVDLEYLATLPDDEFRNGLVEIIKHAVIADKKLFSIINDNIKNNGFNKKMIHSLKKIRGDKNLLKKIISRSIRIKAAVAGKDELEKNLRKILNFGHTVGHAIEAATHYRIPHGEAVAMGMKAEGLISNYLGYLSAEEMQMKNALLDRLGIKNRMVKDTEHLIKLMKKDKKAAADAICMALPAAIGKMKSVKGDYAIKVPAAIIRKALCEAI